MKLLLGGSNGEYLRAITDDGAAKTEEVLAAVAYATDDTLLFDWCYAVQQKVAALSKRIWNDKSEGGKHVCDLLRYILFGGATDDLPERLWQGVVDPKWKIGGSGVSALGELVGWAFPDKFPPRNGRTSKALRSLGYDVTVHV